MLTVIISVFDPQGFLPPFPVSGKILLQKVWRSGIRWYEHCCTPTERRYYDIRLAKPSLVKTFKDRENGLFDISPTSPKRKLTALKGPSNIKPSINKNTLQPETRNRNTKAETGSTQKTTCYLGKSMDFTPGLLLYGKRPSSSQVTSAETLTKSTETDELQKFTEAC